MLLASDSNGNRLTIAFESVCADSDAIMSLVGLIKDQLSMRVNHTHDLSHAM
jgi:hypothetical protein